MALLKVGLAENGLTVFHTSNPGDVLEIPFSFVHSGAIPVRVLDDTCEAKLVGKAFDQWFSNVLKMPCQLVFMPV